MFTPEGALKKKIGQGHRINSVSHVSFPLLCSCPFCGGQAWAVASGKINEFPNDKARWKTNFRCALNNLSVRFKMVQDNSKNSDDPHKIYEIINTECEWESYSVTYEFVTVEGLLWEGSKRNGSVLVCRADCYENLPTQDSQEDSDLTPDIYSSPIDCFPLGTEVVQLKPTFISSPPPDKNVVPDSFNNTVSFSLSS